MKRRGFLKLLGIAPVAAAVAVAVEPSGISGELPPTEFADPNVDDKPILFDCEKAILDARRIRKEKFESAFIYYV